MKAEPVRGDDDLRAILDLQRKNLASALGPEETAREGFVTVAHTLEDLRALHALAPSLIVREGEALAGYALAMPLACRDRLPVLYPMFRFMETVAYRGRPLLSWRSYVMGQICVAREYRGKGVVAALYGGHAEVYGPSHDLVVTEISARNTRSLRAHGRIGFLELGRYRAEVGDSAEEWSLVGWDFRS